MSTGRSPIGCMSCKKTDRPPGRGAGELSTGAETAFAGQESGPKKVSLAQSVYSDSNTMIATNTSTSTGGTMIA